MQRVFGRVLLPLLLAAVLLATGAAAAMPERLVPVGATVGIRLEADGLLVVGFDRGRPSPARQAGLRKGDVLKAVNGEAVEDCQALQEMVAACGGGVLTLTVERDGQARQLALRPAADGDGYRLGVSLRDSMAGIGTVTFYDPERDAYGALGHGVNDLETMVLLPLEAGAILPSSVVAVQKGACGAPGLLKGAFNTSETLGTVEANTDHGIFGRGGASLSSRAAVPLADAAEVHTGEATILANIHNTTVEAYQVEITKLFPEESTSGRNLLLTITDPRLLRQTGGIVQGMSGSPILQDGKLVGAVTHVLVNNPTCGYGIFIANMLENCAAYAE